MPNPSPLLPVLAAAVLLSGDRPAAPRPPGDSAAPPARPIRIERPAADASRAAGARRFAEWHPVYLRALEPLRGARLALAEALSRRSLDDSAAECEALGRAVRTIDRSALLAGPDHRLRRALRRSLDGYLAASRACAAGDLLAAHDLLIEADLQLRGARLLVERWRAGPVPLASLPPEGGPP